MKLISCDFERQNLVAPCFAKRQAQATLRAAGVLLALLLSVSLHLSAQTSAPSPAAGTVQQQAPVQVAQPAKPTLSLSPAVVMARGNFGQGLTQTLTLSNQTGRDLSFDMVAQDIVVKDGKRVFVTAGETENSIAATAVFSQKSVLVKAGTAVSVDVRLTIPQQTAVRAVSAIFMGTDRLPTSNGGVGMTASLAALITFNLTGNVKLAPDSPHVEPATASANMTITQWIANTGSEPVLPEGTAAVLNAKGVLMGKATFAQQRLLPGERLQFAAEFPEQLPPGDYRALCSYQFEGQTLTNAAEFKIADAAAPTSKAPESRSK